MFDVFALPVNLLIFSGLAALVWLAGTRLSYCIDAIAEQTKLARVFLGLILLATATELPEMVTTITAATGDNGALALNNMFGGMMMQLAVLAIADMFAGKIPLSARPGRPTVMIAGLMSIISLSALILIEDLGDVAAVAHIGIGSFCMGLIYLSAMYVLKRTQQHTVWSPVDLPDEAMPESRTNRYDETPLKRLVFYSIAAAAVILVCGVLVVRLADTLAVQTGLGTSFIGVSLLAMTTSLPELSTSVAAVRVKAYSMAISNIFGSNLIMTFLVFPVDIFFFDGPLLNQINDTASFALGAGIILTTIYCLGLLTRPKIKIFKMGLDSLIVMIGYLISMGFLYHLR